MRQVWERREESLEFGIGCFYDVYRNHKKSTIVCDRHRLLSYI